MTNGKKLIVFVCTGNTCRSPMAEALLKSKLSDNGQNGYDVISRGISVDAGAPASQHSISVMKEYGCDISHHKATPLSLYELKNSDLLIAMTENHARILKSFGADDEKVIALNIADPFGKTLDDYRECASTINAAVNDIYERF